jgi:hypothetical protein
MLDVAAKSWGLFWLAAPLVVLGLVAWSRANVAPAKHMNNVTYVIANPADPAYRPTFHGEHFEFLSPPITTRYSEVFWTSQPQPLPAHIIKRFENRVMAITG